MKTKSACADDPRLQDKIDELTRHPDFYFLELERLKMEDVLECNKRMFRALEKEIVRGEATLYAIKRAIETVKEAI